MSFLNWFKNKPIIIEEKPHKRKEYFYNPRTFDEFIGQDNIKNTLKDILPSLKDKPDLHFLLTGKAGTGKTTLARIMANYIGIPFIEKPASSFKCIEEVIITLNQFKEPCVLFLDEVHSLKKELLPEMLQLLINFEYDIYKTVPFVLIGGTTEAGHFKKGRYSAFMSRCVEISLNDYSNNDLYRICKLHRDHCYNTISNDKLLTLSKNTRGEPRQAVKLLRLANKTSIKNTLKLQEIILEGFTIKDLNYLKYLSENPKGVGLITLTSYLETDKANIEHGIEPYLLKNRLIIKGSKGRQITDKGIKILKILQKSYKENY